MNIWSFSEFQLGSSACDDCDGFLFKYIVASLKWEIEICIARKKGLCYVGAT